MPNTSLGLDAGSHRFPLMTEQQEAQFRNFHRVHPHVYEQLKTLALRLKNVGVQSYGMKALFEILRFNALLSVDNNFELNNNYAPLYARLLMKQEEELQGFFKIRTLR